MNPSNPFVRFDTEKVLRPQRRSIFPVRLRGPQTAGEIEIAKQRLAEGRTRETIQGTEIEHLHSMKSLVEYLEEPRENEKPAERIARETACSEAFSCNPWKYEPLLLDDLLKARIMQSADDIQQMRGLIRAGSWNTYQHESESDILQRLKTLRSITEYHRQTLIRTSDPTTSREHHEDLQEELAAIDHVISDVRNGVTGEALEASVKTIENINVTSWHDLKRHHAIRGEQPRPDAPDALTKQLYQEIALIRPIRDLLYLRRLYPVLAQKGLQPKTVQYTSARKNLIPPPLPRRKPVPTR